MKTLSPRARATLIFLATFLAYWPALGGGFIWDDQPGHVTRPELRSCEGLVRIWTEPGATQQYYPLLHSAFWFEYQLWGDAPFGYHLVNVLLHAAAACLFAALLLRLAVPGATLAALLFALHPVGVESVAWVSEQKNTLSLVCYLCAALAYLRFDSPWERDRPRSPRAYALATAFFIAALLSKTVTATLPAALLVLAWWQRGTLSLRRDVVPLLPWFVCSAFAAVATASFEYTLIGAQGADFALTATQRLLLASRAVWFYFGKLLLPLDLSFIYARVVPDPTEVLSWLVLAATVTLLATLVGYAHRSGRRGPLAVALLFGGALFPALGFIDVFPFLYSFVADHFQYLPSLAIFAFAAAALTRLSPRVQRVTSVGLISALAALSFHQAGHYRDVFTLYTHTLEKNPTAWMAHNNLGVALVQTGRADEAIAHFEKTLALRPNYAEAENNLGDALNQLGRSTEAIPHLETALRLQPLYAEAANNLGIAFMATQRADEGLARFAEAIRLKPTYALAHRNLGLATARSGRTAESIPHFARAVALNPAHAEAQLEWATALTILGRYTEAFPHFEAALTLNPTSADTHATYARALGSAGRLEDSARHASEAKRLGADRPR